MSIANKNINDVISTIHEEMKSLPVEAQLAWAIAYRAWRKKDEKIRLKQKSPTMMVTYKPCKNSTSSKKTQENISCDLGLRVIGKKIPTQAVIDRNILTQCEYMKMLAQCARRSKKKPCRCKNKFKKLFKNGDDCKINYRKRKAKKKKEPCPARLAKMAIPQKRYVLANWKTYQNFLPTETLLRFYDIINNTDKNLEIVEAREYFNKLDRKIKAKNRKKRCRKAKNCCPEYKKWLQEQIDATSESLVRYFVDLSWPLLNAKQISASSQILVCLYNHRFVKSPSRNPKSYFHEAVVEFCDKIVSWVDVLYQCMDQQPLNSLEDIVIYKRESRAGDDDDEEWEEEESGEVSKGGCGVDWEEAEEREIGGFGLDKKSCITAVTKEGNAESDDLVCYCDPCECENMEMGMECKM